MSSDHYWNPSFDLVFALTNRVMGWFGFTYDSDYMLLPDATRVAVEIVKRASVPGRNWDGPTIMHNLTREDIERADESTGRRLISLWEALNGPYRTAYVSLQKRAA